ncbi:MFS transporter [Fodinicola feengrottensis]|uniref:MFS transporter n=1 Tax=Fodinicola feengrottensis TaxID=435914 RepID=UPI0031D531C5
MAATPARPATYRQVFALVEARVLLGTQVLSLVGDLLATVALTVLVYTNTGSTVLAAATFAIGYLPWVVGGPILAALADRLPWRRTMVACDLIRAGVVGLLAWPGIPLPILLALLFASALVAPPFEAARSALMPVAIPGDAFVLANSLQSVLRQTTQVAGFLIAGVLVALLNARGALLADALTFALSAAAIRLWIKHRDAPPKHPERRSLLQETVDGMRLVLGHKVLRPYLILAFITSGCVYASEGLSAPFAKHLNGGGPQVIGILLASIPIGEAIGAIVLGRFASPTLRPKLVVPMAIMSGCVLVPIALDPPLPVVSLLYALSGFGVSCMTIVNANYVRAIAPQFRGRAFGVAQSGLQISQGVGVLIAGALASVLLPPHVVALCGAAGALGIMLLASAWPSVKLQDEAMEHPATGPVGKVSA